MRQRCRQPIEHIGMGDLAQLRQARPCLHAHHQHQDGQQSAKQRFVETGVDCFGPPKQSNRNTKQQRRNGRAAEGVYQNTAHKIAIHPVWPCSGTHRHRATALQAGRTRSLGAHFGQNNGGDQCSNVHERVQRTDKALVKNAVTIQHRHSRGQRRGRDGPKQPDGGHRVHLRDTGKSRQCLPAQ